jgi:PAS domain S-box-containing protein
MLDEIFGIDQSYNHNLDGWAGLIHPDDKEQMIDYFQNYVLKLRNNFDKEYRIIRSSDKKEIWVHGVGELELDNEGNPIKMFGTIQDVTNRKKAEETLRKNEEKLSSIFRAAPTGIGVVKNRVLVEVNDRICEMVGYTREELIGKSSRMVYPDESEFEFVGQEKYRQITEHGSGTVETRWRTKDGRILNILLSSSPINTKDLSEGVTFTALDITDRKKAEDAIRMFQFATDKAADAVFWINRDGGFYYVNDQACRSLGYGQNKRRMGPCLAEISQQAD